MHSCVIVPVKRFALAKSRLATRLPATRRRAFANAMAEDVMRVVTRAQGRWSAAVITSEPSLAVKAEQLGAAVIAEPRAASLAKLVESAAAALAHRGFGRFAYVPADVPLVRTADVAHLIGDRSEAESIRYVVADRDGSISAISWPASIQLEIPFGAGGTRRLTRYATATAIRCELLDLPRLALDLDIPEDLERFAQFSTTSRASRLLDSWADVA